MYGTTMSAEMRKIKSDLIKSRIAPGAWTPHVHNSRTHWESKYNGKPYRSSWEAIYASLNPGDQYERLRIPHMGVDNEMHTYLPDFVNRTTRIVTEIKPVARMDDENTQLKMAAAYQWGNQNEYTLRVLTEDYFSDNIHRVDFEKLEIANIAQKLRKIYETSK